MRCFDFDDSQSDLHLCCSIAAKSDFLSKDIALKSDSKISSYPRRFYPATFFFFKNRSKHLP